MGRLNLPINPGPAARQMNCQAKLNLEPYLCGRNLPKNDFNISMRRPDTQETAKIGHTYEPGHVIQGEYTETASSNSCVQQP